VDNVELPDTDSPAVMNQAVALWLTNVIWDQYSRVIHADEIEEKLLEVYGRVYKAVEQTHGPQ
jgi:hypothetical protein